MRIVDPVKHAIRRHHILEAAGACFASNGFEATRIADICAAANISSGNLFHYFPSKQAIFMAIFEDDGQQLVEQLAQAANAADPLECLYAFVEGNAAEAESPHVAGLMLAVISQAQRDQAFAELMQRNDALRLEGLTTLLKRLQASGQLDVEAEVSGAVHALLVIVEGLYLHAASDSGYRPSADRERLRRMVDAAIGRSG